jgi:GTPase Era involved in 16S rRNA processing
MTGGEALPTLATSLLQLASAEQRPAVQAVLVRAHERRLRVLIVGEAKRGKSTLINRLLDRDLLPTGVLPVTAIATTVSYGDRDELRVEYLDGRTQLYSLDALSDFVTERANPQNRLGVAEVNAVLAEGRLAGRPVELVDTPGTGSIFEHNTNTARHAHASLDAVIMVVTATPPMSAAERDLLISVSRHAVKVFVVVNKADQLSADELAETKEFTATICAGAGVQTDPVFTMSARDADAGFTTFREAFETYLAERGRQDTERALRGHLVRLAAVLQDEIAIELRAAEMAHSAGRAQVEAFADQLGGIVAHAAELTDRCHATERRLRRDLDQDARRFSIDLGARCRQQTEDALAVSAELQPDEVDKLGRDTVERAVSEAVLTWRDAHAHKLEQQLASLVDTIEAERARQLDSLRHAVLRELGVAITATVEPLPLRPGRLFWLDFAPAPAVEMPGAELLRRHGPGAARRARQRVISDIPAVTDRQVGRARADLQQRLDETMRQLVAALRTEHAEALTRIQEAVQRVAAATERDDPLIRQEVVDLRDRSRQISDLMARINVDSAPLDC